MQLEIVQTQHKMMMIHSLLFYNIIKAKNINLSGHKSENIPLSMEVSTLAITNKN